MAANSSSSRSWKASVEVFQKRRSSHQTFWNGSGNGRARGPEQPNAQLPIIFMDSGDAALL